MSTRKNDSDKKDEVIGKKSNEQGYIWVPYIIQTLSPVISEGSLSSKFGSRRKRRMKKINKIYESE
jgi:hypothetical protein